MKRRVFSAALWASAVGIWVTMGHALLGTPDVAPIVVPIVFGVILSGLFAKRATPARIVRPEWRIDASVSPAPR